MKRSQLPLTLFLVMAVNLAVPGGALWAASESKVLTILLCNDEGFNSPGLEALYQAVSSIGTVVVAAPKNDRRSTGHGPTHRDAIVVEKIARPDKAEWYAIDAAPATCVRLALARLLTRKPDVVISGIHRGETLGVAAFSSTTVAAAREAAINEVPSLAVSLKMESGESYGEGAAFVRLLVRQLQQAKQLRPGLFLNLNIPAADKQEIKGVQITRQSLSPTMQVFEQRINPRQQVYYWNTYQPLQRDRPGTDVLAFQQGYISITPFQVDQTRKTQMKSLNKLRQQLSLLP